MLDVLQGMIELTDKSEHPDRSDLNHSAYVEGCAHYKVENFYLAADSFTEALDYWAEDSQAWMALGNCFDEIGKPRKAEYCYRRSLEFSPDDARPKVQYNLANSIFDQDRFDEAIELYRLIPETDPVREQSQKNLQLATDLRRKQQAEQGGAEQSRE